MHEVLTRGSCPQGSAAAQGAGELPLGRGGDPAARHAPALQPLQARGERQGQVRPPPRGSQPPLPFPSLLPYPMLVLIQGNLVICWLALTCGTNKAYAILPYIMFAT